MKAMTNREDLAWVAGIIDGEGCISLHRPKGRVYPRLTVGQSGNSLEPPEMLKRIVAIVGFGKIYRARDGRHQGNWRPHWQYEANGFEKCQAFVAMVWHWLTPEKKLAAEHALTTFRSDRFIRSDLCPNGHPYSERFDKKGRRCRICNTERERKRRAQQIRQTA